MLREQYVEMNFEPAAPASAVVGTPLMIWLAY